MRVPSLVILASAAVVEGAGLLAGNPCRAGVATRRCRSLARR